MKFSTRISSIVIGIFILIVSISLVLFFVELNHYNNVYEIYYEDVNKNTESLLLNESKKQITSFNELHKRFSIIDFEKYESVKQFLDAYELSHEGYVSVFFTDVYGNNIVSNEISPRIDGRERQWYIDALDSEDVVVLKPYIDLSSREKVMTLSKKVTKDNQLQGVLGVDISIISLLDNLKSLIDENFIISSDSILLETTLSDFSGIGNFEDKLKEYVADNGMVVQRYNLGQFNLDIDVLIQRMSIYKNLIFLRQDFISHFTSYIVALIIALTTSIGIFIYINHELNSVGRGDIELTGRMKQLEELYKKLEIFLSQNQQRQSKLIEEKKKYDDEYDQLVIELNRLEIDFSHHIKEITRLEDTYSDLIANIPDMVWLMDTEGHLLFYNEEIICQLGYSKQEMSLLKLNDLIEGLEDDLLIKMLEKRDFKKFEMTLLSKDGLQKIAVNVRTKRIFVNGQLKMIQGICKDISVDKKMFYDYHNMNKELYLLNDISRILIENLDLNTMLKSIVEKIAVLLNFDVVCIGRNIGHEIHIIALNERNELVELNSKHLISDGFYPVIEEFNKIDSERDLLNIDFKKKGYSQFILPLKNDDTSFGVLIIYNKENIEFNQINLLKSVAINATIAIEKSLMYDKLQDDYFRMIESLVNAVEMKLESSKGHAKKVGELSVMIGERFYLHQDELNELYVAGLLHDIGKIGIEDSYFIDGSIDIEEKKTEIKKHVQIGRNLIEDIGLTMNTIEGVYYHHLNYDTSGYPETDLVEQPFIAGIIQLSNDFVNYVCDDALSLDEAYNVMERQVGIIYTLECIRALGELLESHVEELETIISK